MKPLLQQASWAAFGVPIQASRPFIRTVVRLNALSICARCQHRTSTPVARVLWNNTLEPVPSKPPRRQFHQTTHDERRPPDEKEPPKETSAEVTPTPDVIALPSKTSPTPERPNRPAEPRQEERVESIPSVPAKDLPSHREAQRWGLSKRLTEWMDEILPKLAVVTQKVNTMTGTDYSGIEALKREIKEHEKLVRHRREAIEEAKQALDAAMAQQASSQKEVVALLERKHSWSDRDLERYMSLIRSEHVNEQAVREAKEAISNAENALEEARAQLERRERAQYHEEQIWSDTIRRNSTWVTFGLMGVNIVLLLASLVIFEPWRRRRMVREVKNVLEAHKQVLEPSIASAIPPGIPAVSYGTQSTTPPSVPVAKTVRELPIDQSPQATVGVVEGTILADEPSLATTDIGEKRNEETTQSQQPIARSSTTPPVPAATPLTTEGVAPQEAIDIEKESNTESNAAPESWKQTITFIAHDLVSDRLISMRRIDFTTAILQSAAAGAVIAAAAIAILQPR